MSDNGSSLSWPGAFIACLLAIQISTCSPTSRMREMQSKVESIDTRLAKIEQHMEQPAAPLMFLPPEGVTIYSKNVLGGPENERFYLLEGQRIYLEIDGKPLTALAQQR